MIGATNTNFLTEDETLDAGLRRGQIVLVGLMGSGKSAIGRRLAKKLRMSFVDADAEIEAAADCTIAEIFERDGEAVFRDRERQVIGRLLTDGRPKVLATGGGAFMDETLRASIKEHGIAVWLNADLDILVERTSRRSHRPILRDGNPREILARLIDERYSVYAQAQLTVVSGNRPPADTVARALEKLRLFQAERT